MNYIGNDLYHNYKGYRIKKVEKYYSQGNEFYYLIERESEIYDKLRDAKREINRRWLIVSNN